MEAVSPWYLRFSRWSVFIMVWVLHHVKTIKITDVSDELATYFLCSKWWRTSIGIQRTVTVCDWPGMKLKATNCDCPEWCKYNCGTWWPRMVTHPSHNSDPERESASLSKMFGNCYHFLHGVIPQNTTLNSVNMWKEYLLTAFQHKAATSCDYSNIVGCEVKVINLLASGCYTFLIILRSNCLGIT
jgi:hypothetical protein